MASFLLYFHFKELAQLSLPLNKIIGWFLAQPEGGYIFA